MPCTWRSGHAGAALGSRWFIAGGGNNSSGCSDMMVLELQGLGRGGTLRWSHVVDVEPRSALASEGLSLLAVPEAGILVSFGGYNGKYYNSVHLFKPGAAPGCSPIPRMLSPVTGTSERIESVTDCLPACLPACLPVCLSACLPV